MTRNIQPFSRNSILKLIDSPFQSFIDEFFNDSLPFQLVNRQDNYPKFNIFKESKDDTNRFSVELCIAGFSKEDLSVTTENDILTVNGSKNRPEDQKEYIYKGVADRDFTWSLKLPKRAEIEKVKLVDGILKIDIIIKKPDSSVSQGYKIE